MWIQKELVSENDKILLSNVVPQIILPLSTECLREPVSQLEGCRNLPEDDAQDLRMRVCGILRSSKLPKDNITRSQRVAQKEIKGLHDQVILPADKGNGHREE